MGGRGALLGALAVLALHSGPLEGQSGAGRALGTEPVRQVRVDADGNSVPDRLGNRASIAGRLTVTPYVAVDGTLRSYLQDETAAIRVSTSDPLLLLSVAAGDLVRATGRVDQRAGMTVLMVDQVERLDRGVTPDPSPLSISASLDERFEGRLVEVRGRLQVGPSVELVDQTGAVELALGPGFTSDPGFARTLASGREVIVVGVIEQVDATAPFRDGYVLHPRDRADIMFVPGAPWPLILASGAVVVLALTSLGLWGLANRHRARAGAALLEQRTELLEDQRRFLAEASHQIRTPLTVLRGSIEVALLRERSVPEYRAIMRNTLEDVKGVTELANDLIALARTDEAARKHETVRLPIRRVVEEAVHAVRSRGRPSAGVGVVIETDQHVDVDPVTIHRALGNVLDNALKYAAEQPILVHAREGDTGRVEVEVADRGPGIPKEDLERVFERFYRGRSRSVAGSGLGLPIARAIMEQHGGGLEVEQRRGGGTSFVLWLLPSASPEEPDRPAPDPEAHPPGVQVSGGPVPDHGRAMSAANPGGS